ncbi:M23 family metallopeptidase [Microbacterium sp.]|uniref:M23 family metallopeptidase n=1 Tax=Microbacterium sp. TaxID=51671 RepID=UPI003A8D3887
MAEEIDSTALEPTEGPGGLAPSRRGLRAAASPTRPSGRRESAQRASAAPHSAPRKKRSPLRSLAVVGMITALVGAVGIPAFAAANSAPEARTIQQVAADDAQSLVVGSSQKMTALARDSYSATTSGEIAKKKAEEAAAARARQAARLASLSTSTSNLNLNMVGPGTGAIRWPLAKIDHIGDGFGARGGEHQGVDLLTAGGTPIFASTAGTVIVSSEGYYGYGVAVEIETVIDGTKVTTLYGHMRYGSRQVSQGQKVAVGQVIGLVGSTGRSTANHLHFEVALNGTKVDPLAWLRANAG